MNSILIANRGEVALRINATCQALGIKTIAIYTQEDQTLSYVFKANRSYKLSQNGLAGYLNQEEIIQVAHKAGAQAIHPGYGFLAENAEFAQKVIDAGLTWIGPTPKNIATLANKAQAQKLMIEAQIPTIPGYSFVISNPDSLKQAKQAANMIGFPVILKCADGGGGKAMRSVKDADHFTAAWSAVASEAKKIFDSDLILVEKRLKNPRHVEVQIAGDGQNYIHLYERECSVQRNHQKVIEWAPSTYLNATTKQEVFKAALKAAQAVQYENIGTVEFLVTPDQHFYFLEMNTRLQVEHSVTEQTTNIDLVAAQLHIAITRTLPYKQHEIRQQGYAIECRIYSENPAKNFIPSTGTITHVSIPNNPFLRIDHDLEEGMKITPFFDPMLAKLTTWSHTRAHAIAYLTNTLRHTNISGVETNIEFLLQILESEQFVKDEIHVQLLQDPTYLETVQEAAAQSTFSETDHEKLATQLLKNSHKLKQSALLQPEDTTPPESPNPQDRPCNRWRNQRWK